MTNVLDISRDLHLSPVITERSDIVHLRDLPESETRTIPKNKKVIANCGKIVIPQSIMIYNNGNNRIRYDRETNVCTECLLIHREKYEGRTFALESEPRDE